MSGQVLVKLHHVLLVYMESVGLGPGHKSWPWGTSISVRTGKRLALQRV